MAVLCPSNLLRLLWIGASVALPPMCLLGQEAVVSPSLVATGARVASAKAARVARAVRVSGALAIDARLDEPAWRTAEVLGDFRQRRPDEGAPASERTEVRLLYDDAALYVGATMYDSRPESIAAELGRRDQDLPSDELFVNIDSYFDRRTAFTFSVTPRGVKKDFVISGENFTDYAWDAVWDVAARVDSVGWHAEFRLPLTQLRFSLHDATVPDGRAQGAAAPDAPVGEEREAVWGVNFIRWLSRRQEDMQWSLIPRAASTWVAHYGELHGVRMHRAPRRLEVQPYALAQVTRAPREPGDPFYQRNDFGGAVGADLKVGVTPNLTLSAAINPDFGQVEADPSEVNLTAFETFFEEKRPFFTEGSDIFRFFLGGFFAEEHLFYSRRVGRTPQLGLPDGATSGDTVGTSSILAAAKLSGKTASGWSIGVLRRRDGRGDGTLRGWECARHSRATSDGRATQQLRRRPRPARVPGRAERDRRDRDRHQPPSRRRCSRGHAELGGLLRWHRRPAPFRRW